MLLLRVCFCLAKEIPRDRRVHRQLHIDRIPQNRQFRSATYITAIQICQPERKTLTVELLVFYSVFAVGFVITRYLTSRYLS